MTVKKVLRIGDPRLLQQSTAVKEFNTSFVNELLTDMWDTMYAENGAGLAAPQIGINLRVVIFGFKNNPRYPDAPEIPDTVLINPEITVLDNSIEENWEGCLSVPGMRGLVPRYSKIKYSGYNEKGESFCREVSGFHARVVQHECDHLDGILYPQRITDMKTFGFRDELEKNGLLAAQPCDD